MIAYHRNDPMRSLLTAAAAALLPGRSRRGASRARRGPAHPNPIIVREFAASPGVVTLDPSFGFSLNRGAPGVPPRQRAAGVARAAAFSLADAIAQQLGALGYDAIRSDTAAPEPGARALIVTGAFRHIDEGRRRQVGAENPSIAVDADDRLPGRTPPRRSGSPSCTSIRGRSPQGAIVGVSARRGVDVNLAATRVGGAIARYVARNRPAQQLAGRLPLMRFHGPQPSAGQGAAGARNTLPRARGRVCRRLQLALGLQHAHGVAQRRDGVVEFGLAMGRRDDAAGVAAEIDPVDHHAEPQLVDERRRCGRSLRLAAECCERVEPGRGDRDALGVGEDFERREGAVGRPRHPLLLEHLVEPLAQSVAIAVGAGAGIGLAHDAQGRRSRPPPRAGWR